jgi:hypothetical protein
MNAVDIMPRVIIANEKYWYLPKDPVFINASSRVKYSYFIIFCSYSCDSFISFLCVGVDYLVVTRLSYAF